MPLYEDSVAVTENVNVPAVVGVPSITQSVKMHCGEISTKMEVTCKPGGSDDPDQLRLRLPIR